MRELSRVVAPGGVLLFAVPIGRPRLAFNAHRIYSHAQIVEQFRDLELAEFALIPDDDVGLICPASAAQADAQRYGCGCFWFRRSA